MVNFVIRIDQEQLAREWSKEYDGSGSKLEKLKEASHSAYEEAEKRAQKEVKERQDIAERMKWMAKAGDFKLPLLMNYMLMVE